MQLAAKQAVGQRGSVRRSALTLDAIDCLMPHASNLDMTVVRPQRRKLSQAEGHYYDHSRPRNEF